MLSLSDPRRLAVLEMLELLHATPDPDYDRLTQVAASALRVPIALITFVGADGQWIPSRIGWDAPFTSLLASFCWCAVEQPTLLEVPDATLDPRFSAGPLVTGPQAIRFYAGHPILFEGVALGTLCALDRVPRLLSDSDRAILANLAGLVEGLLRSRHHQRMLVRQETQSRRLAAALQQSEARYRLLWETTTDVVLMIDETSTITFANPAIQNVFGYEVGQVVGQNLRLLQPASMQEAHRRGMARYLQTSSRRLDWRLTEALGLHRDGHEFPIEISFSEMTIEGERTFAACLRDITQRKVQQRELQASEERYRRIVETAVEGIWTIDALGVTTFVNPAMARMLGHSVEEMCGKPIGSFAYPGHDKAVEANLARRKSGISEQHEFKFLHADGTGLWAWLSTSPIEDAQGVYTGALAMVTDISQRKKAEDALRASESRFRALTALSSDWYWEQDAHFRFTSMTGGTHQDEQLGLPSLMGKVAWEVAFAPHDTEALAAHKELLSRHLPFRDFEITHRISSGEVLTLCISGEPVVDELGQFAGYRGVGRNVTEQKKAQSARRELAEQLRESQKMEAIGVLAGGIAHDFNNVLAGILGNVALAIEDLPTPHPTLQSLREIQRASLRGRELIKQILTFARREPHEFKVCLMRPLVVETLSLLRSTLPAGITVLSDLGHEPFKVVADATQVEQVVMNLCTNAWHSLERQSGVVRVTLSAVTLSEPIRIATGELQSGRYVLLSVSDTGQGMDSATKGRIFDPFFTTKGVGEGTGLGLSVAHGIVTGHGGGIDVESAPGRGSTFYVYVPLYEGPLEASMPSVPPPATPRGNGECVMYIDDDDVMVLLVDRMLQRVGFNVAAYQNAKAAIARFQESPGAFDAVVTDFNMPEMSGLDVAREVAVLRPGTPVIISSGNIPEDLIAEARKIGVRALMQKQNTLEELGSLLQHVLGGGERVTQWDDAQ